MGERLNLTRGGIYLAKLGPAKKSEIGKIRPVIILTAQRILDVLPPLLFVCPLSSKSQPYYANLHIKIIPRDKLLLTSYALVEHCRSITTSRLDHSRLAQLKLDEIDLILHQLQKLI